MHCAVIDRVGVVMGYTGVETGFVGECMELIKNLE